MAVIQKKKLCWNCEGNVSLADETCPYCGVSVIPASLDGPSHSHSPPYQMGEVQESAIPLPPYNSGQKNELASEGIEEEVKGEQDLSVNEFKNILLSLLLLLAGSMFFLFGLTLVLFSHNGVFTLQWDGSFWFIYSLLSIPLLFFGWRALLKLDSDAE
ncbi:MAG: hypothetical protein H0X29_04515 [Parachlamydiaceae bacterium]|nr:hypothetical protein [Parachlamydiaceae bacterium]